MRMGSSFTRNEKANPIRSGISHELDLTSAEAKATYKEIQGWMQEKYDFHVSNLNIAQVMHVSSEWRGQGIGRRLFEAGKDEARKNGAEALYISACSSEETIAFYRAMGSVLASNPIKEIAEEEPFDLQMICPVNE